MNWKYSLSPDFHGRLSSRSGVPGRVGVLPRALISERWGVSQIPCLPRSLPSHIHDSLWYSVSVSRTRREPAQYEFLDQPIEHASASADQSALEY